MGESESGKRPPPTPVGSRFPPSCGWTDTTEAPQPPAGASGSPAHVIRAAPVAADAGLSPRPWPLLHESCALSKQQTYAGVSTERDLARPSSAPAKPTRPPQTPLQKKPLLLWSPGPALAQSEGDVLALGTPTWKGLGRPSLTAPFPGFSCAFL